MTKTNVCRLLAAAGLVIAATGAAQAGVVATWEGSGAVGSDPFGNDWVLSGGGGEDVPAYGALQGNSYWGIPGIGLGTIPWPIETAVSDFHITFTLPQGVTIDPFADPQDFYATRFLDTTAFESWTTTIVGNTVHFVAPTQSAILQQGDHFFVNVGFTAVVNPREFSFVAQWTDDAVGVPLPNSSLMGLGLLGGIAGISIVLRRRKPADTL